jgi:hypothetical protein
VRKELAKRIEKERRSGRGKGGRERKRGRERDCEGE